MQVQSTECRVCLSSSRSTQVQSHVQYTVLGYIILYTMHMADYYRTVFLHIGIYGLCFNDESTSASTGEYLREWVYIFTPLPPSPISLQYLILILLIFNLQPLLSPYFPTTFLHVHPSPFYPSLSRLSSRALSSDITTPNRVVDRRSHSVPHMHTQVSCITSANVNANCLLITNFLPSCKLAIA